MRCLCVRSTGFTGDVAGGVEQRDALSGVAWTARLVSTRFGPDLGSTYDPSIVLAAWSRLMR